MPLPTDFIPKNRKGTGYWFFLFFSTPGAGVSGDNSRIDLRHHRQTRFGYARSKRSQPQFKAHNSVRPFENGLRLRGSSATRPTWMMQQPLLPASPRAVANVPKAACNSSGLSSARQNEKRNILIRDDPHLRHHGQWRMCLRLRVTAAALAALAKMKRGRVRPASPGFLVSQRKEKSVARTCTKLPKVQLDSGGLGCCKNLHQLTKVRLCSCGCCKNSPGSLRLLCASKL
jgi:hypothetical protein